LRGQFLNKMRPILARKPFISVASGAITTGGSADLGGFTVAGYARFVGMYSTVGSLTLRMRTGVASGNYQVSSSFAVNSGIGNIDVLNYGNAGYFDITAAQSTQYSLVLNGEATR
jgi:hypothetical protein